MALLALTRAVPPSLARCELTHLERSPIDIAVAVRQHRRYEQTLEELGCTVRHLAPEPELADSVFVEDAAVVVDELGVITRPGAVSRRGETASVARALGEYRRLCTITEPATLDGGDVLRAGRRLWVGLSTRTNAEGVRQLRDFLAPSGYQVEGIEVSGCLHLKTAVSAIADDLLLLDPSRVDAHHFGGLRSIAIHPDEPFAANVLRIDRTLVISAAAPWTRERLESAGFAIRALEISELAKAEAGLTCCSLILSL